MNLKYVFRTLRYRNYRLFFTGQSISLIGTWMQQAALSWLVYRLTHSALLLGLVAFVGQIPTFLFAPLAGVIADRYNKHHLLIMTQSLAMLQAATLVWFVVTGTIQLWHIVILVFCSGLINALDIPVRQSFVIQMIEDKTDLSNAIALNSSIVNMAKLIGPALAGVIISLVGETLCFAINAVTYIAVLASLFMMKVTHPPPEKQSLRILAQLKEGFTYAYGFIPIRMILLLLGLVSLIGGAYQTMIPVFAKDVFHGGPQILGLLMASSGLGAFCGAIYLASRRTVLGLGRVIGWMGALFGIAIMCFAISPAIWISSPIAFMVGFGMMVQMASSNIVLQMIVDEDKRGRVMSFYTMAFMGTAPIGSLFGGLIANRWGVHMMLFFGGMLCFLGGVVFRSRHPLLRKYIRPIYIKKGIIIPQVAEGLQAANVVSKQT